MSQSSSELAAKLKCEGNAMFMAKDWVLAYSKYTEAIALDEKNAILYANRAACCLQMGRSVRRKIHTRIIQHCVQVP